MWWYSWDTSKAPRWLWPFVGVNPIMSALQYLPCSWICSPGWELFPPGWTHLHSRSTTAASKKVRIEALGYELKFIRNGLNLFSVTLKPIYIISPRIWLRGLWRIKLERHKYIQFCLLSAWNILIYHSSDVPFLTHIFLYWIFPFVTALLKRELVKYADLFFFLRVPLQ